MVDEKLLADARKFRRGALEEILAEQYPLVYRMAMALCGRQDVARGVIRWVFSQSLRAAHTWKTEDAPQHWFLHHTVLTARRAAKHQPVAEDETLLGPGPWQAAYIAFVRAVRSLPQQQKEAYLLSYGERLDPRRRGIAMDCSTSAAEGHLRAADATLFAIAGDQYPAFTDRVAHTYVSFTPTEAIAVPRIRSQVRRYVWPRRIAATLELVAIVAVGYAVWRIYPMLDW